MLWHASVSELSLKHLGKWIIDPPQLLLVSRRVPKLHWQV